MISSALSYVALRLLGEGEGCDDGENGAMEKYRMWILENCGATGIPSQGKTFLSERYQIRLLLSKELQENVLGVYEWSGCNPVPPEFWLFPSFLPYHPAKMWCYCRETSMPMSYLDGRKYHGPITDLVKSLRKEIYTKSYDEIDWNKARNKCCKKDLYYPHTFLPDLLWDGLHYLIEPILNRWPFNKIRERAMWKTLKYMCYEAKTSRYISIECIEKDPNGDEFKYHLARVSDYLWLTEDGMKVQDPNGDEFKYHLARVPDYLWLTEDGMKLQNVGSQTWDCDLATQTLIASNIFDEYDDSLEKAHFYIKESQVKEDPAGDLKSMLTKGSWTFSYQDHDWTVSDCTALSLKLWDGGRPVDQS
ncbi:lupeol synthase 1 [Actinidia rufa]|uniref:Lupeol synthase 1 n=1 Tax=Actinidia rufa TaxID=165716 RepID=A0A7J0ERS3_9ERIC|nr:lupeol synthase 1 [Actinidia rufa]